MSMRNRDTGGDITPLSLPLFPPLLDDDEERNPRHFSVIHFLHGSIVIVNHWNALVFLASTEDLSMYLWPLSDRSFHSIDPSCD